MATITTNKSLDINLHLDGWFKENTFSNSMVLIGRTFFSLTFILSAIGHFSRATIDYAAQQGLPFAEFLVPLSGILALAGGLSILVGYQTRIGALLIILFLVPVTLIMHNYWAVSDPAQAAIQQAMFMKNIAMLGGAFIIFYFGAGPLSVDNQRRQSKIG